MAAVRTWLWLVAILIFGMVVVGGATRLTESGLSITQWKPVSGVVPPLTDGDWQAEFARYREIPQFATMVPDMDLAGFKAIFWWEWAHRLLGRVVGLVVALPLVLFWLTGRLTTALKWKLSGLLLLGAMQGAIGWWMVKSGLSDRTEVSQYRLAVHLLTASLTLALTVWFAASLSVRPLRTMPVPGSVRFGASLLVVGVFLQLGFGAFVAGLRAGRIYDTWPLMGDHWLPASSELWFTRPPWRNLFENATTVQLDHRLMAYCLLLGAGLHALHCRRAIPSDRAARTAAVLVAAVLCQASIGIATLVWGVPLGAALLHQAFAMVVVVVAVIHCCGLRRPSPVRLRAVPAEDGEIIGLPSFAAGG